MTDRSGKNRNLCFSGKFLCIIYFRLWGEHGQNSLERANICLINATAVGCEVIKNLILPGIGSFTIIDGSIVTEEDLGTNFYVEKEAIGSSKSECCMRLLQELNPDVNGDHLDESIDSLLETRSEFFQSFDVVIASNIKEVTLKNLSNLLWDYNIPLVYCRSLGFVGSIRLQFKEHCVIEPHPDNKQLDLRIENPFTALKEHLESSEINSKSPWVHVIYKHLAEWRNDHEGNPPKNYKEKNQFKEMIRKAMKAEEENHEEAIKSVNTVFESGGKISSNLSAIFNNDACQKLSTKDKNLQFWVIVKSMQDFIRTENNDLLPFPGVVPDMTADTDSYIKLQNIYRQKAMQDAENVYQRCLNTLLNIGMKNEIISENTVRLYCREASGLRFIRGSKIQREYGDWDKATTLAEGLECQQPLMELYAVLRAYDHFYTEFGYIPGESYVEPDTPKLKGLATKLLQEWNIRHPISDDMVYEICHYGGAEIHSISAFIGASAAQEVIKLLTQQYVPIDNTFLYSAITTETATYKF